ncbi:MAG TPA: fumarylacetoacetate hydrolase family protein [Xanthobacteraceae bacterium]
MSAAPADPRIARGMTTQLAARRGRIAAGARPIGWKVGFGAPAALAKLGIAAPLVGFLLDGSIVASGAAVSLAGWIKPVAEPEIAVEMGADLPGEASEAAAASVIGALGPAIELADLDQPPDDVEAILAGNIFHRHVVFGPRAGAADGTLGLRGHVLRNGAPHADTAELEANTGRLVDIVRHVADLLADCGEHLRTGDIIIAGSVVAPLFLAPGDHAVGFVLDPIGSVAVRLGAP